MALSPHDIKGFYPIPAANFKVEINGELIAFTEVTGLSREFSTTIYRESKTTQPGSGPEIMYMPGTIKPVHLSLRKGVVRRKSLPALFDWINSTRINQVEKKDILIHLTDEKGNTTITWKVINAFPVRLSGPHFDANSTEVAIEELDLMADTILIDEKSKTNGNHR